MMDFTDEDTETECYAATALYEVRVRKNNSFYSYFLENSKIL